MKIPYESILRRSSNHYRSKKEPMQIRVFPFASLREILAAPERCLNLPDGARVGDAWELLERQYPGLSSHRSSTRIAHNGRLCDVDGQLRDGDELAILPPVGGG